MHLDTAAACAVIGLLTGWFVPRLIAALPEPPTYPDDDPEQPKELYADMARLPGLAWRAALVSAAGAAVAGAALGWTWALPMWVFLAPVGTALAIIDFRTWLLPTRIIWPAYGVVVALGCLAAGATAGSGGWDDLLRAAIGSVIAFVMFYVLWFLPGGGMGFGDVRLSAVLGFVLGFLGWWQLGFGLWVGFLLGSLAWVPLRLLRLTRSRAFPFGPFMLLGALVGLAWGAAVGVGLAG